MSFAPIIPILTTFLATSTISLAWAQDANLVHIPSSAALLLNETEWLRPNSQTNTSLIERAQIAERDATATAAMPADASRYTAQEFNFPTGSLRVLTWQSTPALHQITFETQLYILKGSATVGVGGEEVVVNAGDAVFQPSGILRNFEPEGETVVLSYFVSTAGTAPKAKVVRGRTLDALARKDKVTATIKQYRGDGNAIRHVTMEVGRTSEATNGPVDILVYVVSGRMKRVESGAEYLVNAGDAIRQVANKSGYWDILEPSEFIATDMPFDPSRPRFKLQRTQAVSIRTTPNSTQDSLREIQR